MQSPRESLADHRNRLINVSRDLLGTSRLLIASNRGPVEYAVAENGTLTPHRGRGGLVTGLTAVSQFCKIAWIASAMGEGDRRAAQVAEGPTVASPVPGQNIDVRFVITPRNTYHKYYNVISNPLLWFLQHYMWNSPYTPNIDAGTYDAWHNGYVAVNRAFGEALVEEMRGDQASRIAMIQDYQLYLVAKVVREQVPDAILQHFIHIPWPSPSYWQLLPSVMRTEICEGLCANDIVGFQTVSSARAFLSTVESFLTGAEVDWKAGAVSHKGHVTFARTYPISIDVAGLRRTAGSVRVREHVERLLANKRQRNIVRIDRVDPSKNIVRGFRAYDLLLEAHPELHGEVRFLAFLNPSRTRVREYQRYTQEITAQVEAINEKYGRPDWQPIEMFMENNYLQSVAGMRIYDVLLVNAVVDGMNLVAKEGPIVNERDGVLILSEGTGAYEQLKDGVLCVTPTDLEGTMKAMYEALTMPVEERTRRATFLRQQVEAEDITMWLFRQFDDLLAVKNEGYPRDYVGDLQPREPQLP